MIVRVSVVLTDVSTTIIKSSSESGCRNVSQRHHKQDYIYFTNFGPVTKKPSFHDQIFLLCYGLKLFSVLSLDVKLHCLYWWTVASFHSRGRVGVIVLISGLIG